MERNGIKLRLDLSNATDHGAYFDPLDRADEELKRLVRPDSTVIDIGANIGVYALTFAKLASTGRVIAFEPDPDNFNRLQENVALNSPSNLVVKNVGIGATEQVHRLYRVVESNSGMNRIFKDTVLEESFPFSEISVRPLLDALQDTDTARVELIKVDVEGFELEVLRGCERIIDRDHPDLFIELDDGNLKENGTSAKELVGFLLAKGYLLFDAATGAALNTSDNLESCATDIICSVKPNS